MKTKVLFAAAAAFISTIALGAAPEGALKMTPKAMRINAYEASVSANLIIVKPEAKPDVLDASLFDVETNGVQRVVKIVYTCDDRGEWADGGAYLAFGLAPATDRKASPLLTQGMGHWTDAYPVKVSLKPGKSIKVDGKKVSAIDCQTDNLMKNFLSESDFFRRGTFTGPATGRAGDETLTYGAYEPWALKSDGKQNPLIIWLHGGGEGGTDVSIALMGNEVVSLIRDDIQSHFTTEGGESGCYVLAVQCPTMWMNTASGFGHGEFPSLYSDVLKSTIDHYLDENPDVDRNRIYLGGCSNGGYMTVNMLIRHPKFFAAAYPTCEAYADANITDNQIKTLANENIWIVQSFDDTTVNPQEHCIATFKRLMAAGAKNVWMSMFENVVGMDTPGQKLYGHFSWCYLFNDAVTASQEQNTNDPVPSNNGGGQVAPQGHANIFEWMNAQVLKDEPKPERQQAGGNRGGNRPQGQPNQQRRY
ncbi:MAG: prolyl oligopeptidase family serine peptidase [Bacteroidales bacterium]|nr:prolyl oligopeptidase family serine peptidase [Bacteroidales bacterium]